MKIYSEPGNKSTSYMASELRRGLLYVREGTEEVVTVITAPDDENATALLLFEAHGNLFMVRTEVHPDTRFSLYTKRLVLENGL